METKKPLSVKFEYLWKPDFFLDSYVKEDFFKNRLTKLESMGFIRNFSYNTPNQTLSIKPNSTLYTGAWIRYGDRNSVLLRSKSELNGKGSSLIKFIFCQDAEKFKLQEREIL